MTFQNNSRILNPTIGYPSAGSLGIAGYVGIPQSKFYALGMIMDANGAYNDLSVDSLDDDEYSKALEFGWTDQDLSGLAYLVNNAHVTICENDRTGLRWSVNRVVYFFGATARSFRRSRLCLE